MKTVILLLTFAALALCADDFCYKDTQRACSPTSSKLVTGVPNCNAKYGAIDKLQSSLQKYTNELLYRSFDFLLMSTFYGNYIKNRPGFEKLYRTYSDSLWNDGIELIKYIETRGGTMDFSNIPNNILNLENDGSESKPSPKPNWELNEYTSLAKALDLEKELAEDIFKIHLDADSLKPGQHDAEVVHHIEEEFVSKHRDAIRKLSGYTYDLGKLLDTPDASLAVYMFDEFLQNDKY
ncbi:ferritin heavy chain-like isoform X2 [Sitophilus oryzae]|nr:ferritin heavy chain-like isoform X2 [Sitophilus oryzae]